MGFIEKIEKEYADHWKYIGDLNRKYEARQRSFLLFAFSVFFTVFCIFVISLFFTLN